MSDDIFDGEVIEAGVEVCGMREYEHKVFHGNLLSFCKLDYPNKELEAFKKTLDMPLAWGAPKEYFE